LVGAHYSLFAIQKRRLQINANLQCAIIAGAQRNCDRMISNEDYSITISVGVSVERHTQHAFNLGWSLALTRQKAWP
jgi:hypothetical protein